MKIINLITSVNGIVESVESYIIDEWLAKTDNRFFTEKEAVEIVENKFKEEIIYTKSSDLDEELAYYVENGYVEFINKRHETIELSIVWSGINVKE